MKEWEVAYVMPNLSLRDSFESNLVAIVPYSDERIQTCVKKSSGTNKLVNGFLDSRGKKIEPSALIVDRNSPSKVLTPEALVGFRNIAALSTILPGYSNVDHESSPLGPVYSDFFDFYPVTVGKGEGLITITPALQSLWSAGAPFSGMPSWITEASTFEEPGAIIPHAGICYPDIGITDLIPQNAASRLIVTSPHIKPSFTKMAG